MKTLNREERKNLNQSVNRLLAELRDHLTAEAMVVAMREGELGEAWRPPWWPLYVVQTNAPGEAP